MILNIQSLQDNNLEILLQTCSYKNTLQRYTSVWFKNAVGWFSGWIKTEFHLKMWVNCSLNKI